MPVILQGNDKRQYDRLAEEFLKLGNKFKEVMQGVLRKQKVSNLNSQIKLSTCPTFGIPGFINF